MPFNLKRLRRRLDKDRSGNKFLTEKELKLRKKQRKKAISKITKKLRKGANPIPKNDPILEDVNPNPHHVDRTNCGSLKEDSVIKTKALKVEVCHVPSPEKFNFEKDGFVISDSDIGCYSRPENGNNILIGGEEPDCDEKIYVDPDNWDKNFSEQWKAQVLRQGQRYPDLPISSKVKGVVDMYDVSDDWIPIYDKSDLPGYYMAIGTSGNQFKNAPVAGVLMSNLIEYCERGNDHDKDPLIMNLKYIKRDINLSFFSRNRKINIDSSMTVLG